MHAKASHLDAISINQLRHYVCIKVGVACVSIYSEAERYDNKSGHLLYQL